MGAMEEERDVEERERENRRYSGEKVSDLRVSIDVEGYSDDEGFYTVS